MVIEANEWPVTEVPQVREVFDELPPVLKDIECRMPGGHPYRDSRQITWAHETTHGLNARIRNQPIGLIAVRPNYVTSTADGEIVAVSESRQLMVPVPNDIHLASKGIGAPVPKFQGKNAFYTLNGEAFEAHEPALTLNDVANSVPRDLKGMAFQLYLRDQQRWWNDQPLYVWDEWSAYLNGLSTAMDGAPDGSFSDVLQALEFMVYGTILFGQIRGNIVKPYGETSSTHALASFVRYQTERTARLYEESRSTSLDSTRQADYIRRMFRSDGYVIYVRTLDALFGQGWLANLFNW